MQKIEEITGRPIWELYWAQIAFTVLMITLGFGAQTFVLILAVGYPMTQSLITLTSNDKRAFRQWILYWVLFAVSWEFCIFCMVYSVVNWVISIVTQYYIIKMLALLFFMHGRDGIGGATLIYHKFLKDSALFKEKDD